MDIWSELRMGKYRADNHAVDASQFSVLVTLSFIFIIELVVIITWIFHEFDSPRIEGKTIFSQSDVLISSLDQYDKSKLSWASLIFKGHYFDLFAKSD